MKSGLSRDELARIRAILEAVPSVEKAVLFGSRAMGLARSNSDVDIMLYGDGLQMQDVMQLGSLLEETTLPYQFDLIRHDVGNLALLEHVRQYGKVIFQRGKILLDKSTSYKVKSNTQGYRQHNLRNKWHTVKVGQLGSVITGKTPRTAITENYGGNIPFLTPSDDMEVKLSITTAKTLTERGLSGVKNCLLPPHSVCVSCIGSDLGKVVMTSEPTVTNQQINSIVPNPDYDADFIYYAMCILGKELNRISKTSTAVPIVNKSSFSNYEIDVPPLLEQQAIGCVLSVLDAKIANNTKINHHLEQMAQAIFKSWFVDFEPFGREQPSDWKTVSLGDLCITVTKGTTPTTLKKQYVTQGINFVKAESILDDHSLDFGKLAFIDDETNTLLSRSVIRANDIIFTIAGTLGRFAFVRADLLPANTNQAVAIIRADTSQINPVILYSFFVGELHSDFYTKNIQQAVQANLSLTTIKALPLLMPPAETLSEYSALIEPIFEQIFQNYDESRRLAALRDTLLPRLMSGELSIVDLGDAE